MPQKNSPSPTARIAAIVPTQDLRVTLTWDAGPRQGRTEELDLSPIIKSMKFFRPLRNDPALFATVHPIDFGAAVAWGENEEIDLSAGAIMRLAEEAMRGEDLRAFIASQKLTETSLAALLDYSRRQIVGFINEGRPIPRVVALACKYISHVSCIPQPVALQPSAASTSVRVELTGVSAIGQPGVIQATSPVSNIASIRVSQTGSFDLSSTQPQPQTATEKEPLAHAA